MKHIKTINEYQRTVGFRYSEPREKFSVKLYLDKEISKEIIEDVLKEVDVVFKNLTIEKIGDSEAITDNFSNIDFEESPEESPEEKDNLVIPTTVVSFDMFVYNEKEIDRIIEDISKLLYIDNEVAIVGTDIKFKRK